MNLFLVSIAFFWGVALNNPTHLSAQQHFSSANGDRTNASTVSDSPFIITHESINGKKVIRIFDRPSQRVHSLVIPDCDDRYHELTSIVFHPNNEEVSIACGTNVTVWYFEKAALLSTYTVSSGANIQMLRYSSDGSVLAIVTSDGTVAVWSSLNNEVVRSFNLKSSDKNQLYSIQFSPDGQRVLAGNGDSVQVIDIHSGLVLFELKGHTADVESITYSNFANEIITKSTDGSTYFWNATTGEALFSVMMQRPERRY